MMGDIVEDIEKVLRVAAIEGPRHKWVEAHELLTRAVAEIKRLRAKNARVDSA